VPRRINQIANRLLLLGAVDQRTRIDAAMLGQVLSELTEDGTLSLHRKSQVAPAATAPAPAASPAAAQVAEMVMSGGKSDLAEVAALAQIEGALAQRDAQINELQQAVLELANAGEAAQAMHQPLANVDTADLAEIADRLATLEGRMFEQDRTIRHTLTMLIEWIEAGESQRVAA